MHADPIHSIQYTIMTPLYNLHNDDTLYILSHCLYAHLLSHCLYTLHSIPLSIHYTFYRTVSTLCSIMTHSTFYPTIYTLYIMIIHSTFSPRLMTDSALKSIVSTLLNLLRSVPVPQFSLSVLSDKECYYIR